jgi:hypothetical protein
MQMKCPSFPELHELFVVCKITFPVNSVQVIRCLDMELLSSVPNKVSVCTVRVWFRDLSLYLCAGATLTRFESRPGHLLYWLRLSRLFPSLWKQMCGYKLTLFHGHFFPHYFYVITYLSTAISLWAALLTNRNSIQFNSLLFRCRVN